MPFSRMRILAAVAIAVVAAQASAAASIALARPALERRVVLEAEIVRELNRARADRGLLTLRSAPSLRRAARSHSQSMLERGYFGHESPDGSPFSDRIRRHYTSRGWGVWSVGEALLTIEAPEIDAELVVATWLRSPPHRKIVLSRAWRDTGVGALYAPSAPNEFADAQAIVVTADFGVRSGREDR